MAHRGSHVSRSSADIEHGERVLARHEGREYTAQNPVAAEVAVDAHQVFEVLASFFDWRVIEQLRLDQALIG